MTGRGHSAHKTQKKPTPEESLPTNIEAERTVLGYYLSGGDWRDDITASHFAAEREQTIWHAMRAIHAAGDDIERRRVVSELDESKAKARRHRLFMRAKRCLDAGNENRAVYPQDA